MDPEQKSSIHMLESAAQTSGKLYYLEGVSVPRKSDVARLSRFSQDFRVWPVAKSIHEPPPPLPGPNTSRRFALDDVRTWFGENPAFSVPALWRCDVNVLTAKECKQRGHPSPLLCLLSCAENQPIEGTDIYVALVFSCQELPDLQELNKLVPDAKIVFFNLRLDTLRGDLGLPAFPPKVILFFFVALGVSVETKCRAWWGLSRG